ncbi:hypothetical protein [Herbiconiux sp. L3-i23]|uniref:hypothetical protein n=1 Tax=Herbiconiux sp. L3-i23 TaxID=2905871 RepID=UPI00206B15D0|nr:hypothetical protein [Herbiconiux sp. L3-i23]BDI24164.1 hypothetical protein L3i23_29400 [Herbiconiux sp. L3-i23]
MRQLFRTWVAMAVFGAGLIHLAVAAAAPVPLLAAFAVLGAAELVWAVVTLARGRYVLSAAAPLFTLAPIVVWGSGIAAGVDSAQIPPIALAAGTLLDLIATIAVALERRRGTARKTADSPAAGRLVLGFVAGAFAMAAITLPALGQTAAGIAASNGPHSHQAPSLEIEVDHPGH